MPTPAARALAEFTTLLAYEEIPYEVAEAAKLHLLDTIGCGLAAHALGIATEGREALIEPGRGGPATVIGTEGGAPARDAALANAILCHGLDFDDTHAASACHVSVVVCPAAIAAAQAAGASGRELLTAIVGGNEVVTRIGMGAPGEFHRRGFHPTAICGIFGATAAAARLSSLDAETATNALGIAGSFGSGIFEYLADGSSTKRLHPGWAAHGALVAMRLAAAGGTGPSTVLEGRFGLYACYLDIHGVDLSEQLDDLGERWETPRIAYKPFPACHFMHGAIDAAAAAVADAPVDPDEIEEITVFVPPLAVQAVCEPVEDKIAPRTESEAKFSAQYSVAAMLVHGEVGVATYTPEAITDRRVLELARRVRHEARDYGTEPAAIPGGARVRLRDGRTLEAHLPYQRGCTENPLSADDIAAKFRQNASLALGGDDVEALEGAVLSLERQDPREAFAVLGAATAREEVRAF